MADGVLSQQEIDALLRGIDFTNPKKEKQGQSNFCAADINFEYDNRELERIKNLLIELNKILPGTVTDEFVNDVAVKWVNKYLKVHLRGQHE